MEVEVPAPVRESVPTSAERVPDPVTVADTDRTRTYVAVTLRACDIVTVQGPVELVQAPVHPANRQPSAAVPVSSTLVPSSKVADAVPGATREMPDGVEVVVPLPTWVTSNVRVAVRVAETDVAAVDATEAASTVQ